MEWIEMNVKVRIVCVLGLALALLALGACAGGGNEGAKGDAATAGDGGTASTEGDLETLAGGYTWRREGGIAGFCDIVTLAADGTATVSSCRSDPPQTLAEPQLTAAQASLVSDWVRRFGSFEREQTDPASADAMTIAIEFNGQGAEEPAENDIAALNALAQEVLNQATR